MINVKIWENENHRFLRLFQNENDDKIPILFMMVGIAGSGKTTIANSIEIIRDNEIIKPMVFSSDALRKEMYGDENDQEHNGEIFQELRLRIGKALKFKKHVVLDATNLSKKRRKNMINALKAYYQCHIVCVCVLAPIETITQRNSDRKRKVPNEVIKRMHLTFEPPGVEEEFEEIILIHNYGDAIKRKYTLENFFHGDIDAVHVSQENSHHTLTIGDHCIEAYKYIKERYKGNDLLAYAALMHDIGKVVSKSRLNSHGEDDGECHYYNHQCCGAYDSFFYMNDLNISDEDKLHIANLIYYHMRPFAFNQSEKAVRKIKSCVGEEFFDEIMKLHEADKAAH